MKVLVTGGAGFIGSALVNILLKKGFKVIIFDNFSNSSLEKISHLVKNGVSVIEGDIRDFSQIKNSLGDVDIVIHLAAQINVQKSISNPEETHQINVKGTENILKACVENNVKNIIAVSSAAVYGIPKKLPITENSPTSPISPYGESKLQMETLVRKFSTKNELNGIILRLFNVYGPGQSIEYAGVITKFLECISNNKPLVIFGDGTHTRDFIYLDDVVDAFFCSINKIQGKKGNHYNIASERHISIQNLAKLIIEISGKKLPIKYESEQEGDIPYSETSITLAKQELGFEPKIELKNGLQNLIKSKNAKYAD